jgi:hypothetical protein
VFHLAGTPNGTDKINVDAQQFDDHFLFSALPGKFDTDVVVTLEPGKLTFITTHSFETTDPKGDIVVQTVKGNHGFGLPFNPRQDQVQVDTSGAVPHIRLYFR